MKKLFYFLFAIAILVSTNTSLTAQCFSNQNYSSNGTYTYTIPGVETDEYTIEISATGAGGAYYMLGGNPFFEGGDGASMKASYIVLGGDELTIFVGESGQRGGSPAGGGGGGGSAVIINGTEVLIAAGAGGGGGASGGLGGGGLANTNSSPTGGTGVGASGGGGFNDAGEDGQTGTGGGAGTLSSIGSGGDGGVVAGPGGQGFGGGAGGAGTGGGGGGGYQGGNGGITGALGGLGGDSFITMNYSSVMLSAAAGATGGGSEKDGSVMIKCVHVLFPVTIDLISKTDPECNNEASGKIVVMGSGGVMPYEFSLDGQTNTTGIFENLTAGTYTVTVTDANGDMDDLSVTLSEPSAVVLSVVDVQNNFCPNETNGVIEVQGSGGTSPTGNYEYSIDDGNTFQPSGIFADLANGIYTIICIDDNECVGSVMQEIISPDAVELTIIDLMNVSCAGANDGSITVEANNGVAPYSYSIDGVDYQNSGEFTNLEPGDVTVYAQDDNNCIASIDTTILEPQALTYVIDTISGGCGNDDGFIHIRAIGGTAPYSYFLNDTLSDTGIYLNLATGVYTIEVIDANDCSTTGSVTISASNQVGSNISQVNNITCFGGNNGYIKTEGIGGLAPYEYILNGIETNMTGEFDSLIADLYTVKVLDQNGCSAVDTIILTQPDSLFIDILNLVDESCPGANDGMVSVEGNGGTPPYTYELDETMSTTGIFENLTPGMYDINMTDSLGCATSTTVNIVAATSIMTSNVETRVTCYGENNGTVSFDITGGAPNYNVTFDGEGSSVESGETFSRDSLMSGTHVFSIEDSLGCQIIDTIFIDENSEIIITVDSVYDGTVIVSVTGGLAPYQYSIDGGVSFQTNPMFENLSEGTHTILVVDANGCTAEIMIVISSIINIENENVSLVVYPNPSYGFIHVELNSSSEKIISGELINSAGKKVLVRNSEETNKDWLIDAENMQEGVYFIVIKTDKNTYVRKCILNK